MKGIFITATGTDVGKTYISALLVKKMRESGHNCGYFKPVLSGAETVNGRLIPGDCDYVLKFAGINENPMDFVSYAFEAPLSPHLSSELENVHVSSQKIKNDFEKLKNKYDYIVVEGAGGIVCPFNLRQGEQLLISDIINDLGLDILIVSSAALGSINSAVLTVEYAKQHNINIAGIILNNYNPSDFMQVDNKKQIENLTSVNILGTVKNGQDFIDIVDLKNVFKEI